MVEVEDTELQARTLMTCMSEYVSSPTSVPPFNANRVCEKHNALGAVDLMKDEGMIEDVKNKCAL